MAHHCPKCELVFVNRNELENHLAVDHEAPATPPEAVPDEGREEIDETTSGGEPEPSTETQPAASGERRGLFGWLRGRARRTP